MQTACVPVLPNSTWSSWTCLVETEAAFLIDCGRLLLQHRLRSANKLLFCPDRTGLAIWALPTWACIPTRRASIQRCMERALHAQGSLNCNIVGSVVVVNENHLRGSPGPRKFKCTELNTFIWCPFQKSHHDVQPCNRCSRLQPVSGTITILLGIMFLG